LCAANAQTPAEISGPTQADLTNARCLWGLLASLQEAGRRCMSAQWDGPVRDRILATRTDLNGLTARVEAYLVQNAPNEAPQWIAQDRQRLSAMSFAEMCQQGGGRDMFWRLALHGTGELRAATDQVLAGVGARASACF
jgi:hypothetical protein